MQYRLAVTFGTLSTLKVCTSVLFIQGIYIIFLRFRVKSVRVLKSMFKRDIGKHTFNSITLAACIRYSRELPSRKIGHF